MKKIDLPNKSRRTVSFDVVSSKPSSHSRSFKCISTYKPDKTEKLHPSRVKLKEGIGTAKRSQSVQFVRNTEQPIRKAQSVVNFTPGLKSDAFHNKIDTLNEKPVTNSNITERVSELKLDSPELCTSLRIANKLLEDVAIESKTGLGRYTSVDACSSKNINAKVLRKVNIPFEEHIFKNLVDLKVTEENLFSGLEKRNKSKNFVCVKDQEPELSEFYKPSFDQEYVVKAEKIKVEPECLIEFDGFSISDRMKNWEHSC